MTYTHLTIDELATIYSFWKLHKKAYQVAPALHRSAETVYRIYRFLEAGSTIIDYQWHYRKHKQHCGRKPIQLRPDELAYIQAKTQAGWRTIANQFDLNIHFAAVRAPNQRGLNENTNGLLRRDGLHHNLIMDQLSDELVQVVASRRKHIPRKSLGYQTLLEAFISQITDEQLKNF